MASVNLSDGEWAQVMSLIGDAPWKIAHPLMMKIGEQLRQQAMANLPPPVPAQPPLPPAADAIRGNGQQEVGHE